ncbi:MAG TPA: sulfotransferase [Steroidobacteraceae bacterium]
MAADAVTRGVGNPVGSVGESGSVDEAVALAVELLEQRPADALAQARKVLAVSPDHPLGSLVTGIAQRLLNEPSAAVATLEPLTRQQPKAGVAHYEYGLALAAAGNGEAALGALRRAVELSPQLPGAWRALADHLTAIGDVAAADAAYARHIKVATRNPRLMRAAAALCSNDIPLAESLLRAHLKEHPTDVAAIRMFAEVAARIGRFAQAETLLARCLELSPGFAEARAHYAAVLNRQNRPREALQQLDQLLAADPNNPNHRNLKASILVAIGEYPGAIALYAGLLAHYPRQAKIWLNYGHVLKTSGRQDEALRAYRKCLQLAPDLSDAWFTLANLKTFRFAAEDLIAMRSALARAQGSVDDGVHLNFALGKACEDAGEFAQSFEHYAEGNRLRRTQIQYRAEDNTQVVERSQALYTGAFFSARAGQGAAAPDPIFIVGLPRAGSTLVDQILASHSLVEGTMELYDMIDLAKSLGSAGPHGAAAQYPDVVATLSAGGLRALGETYLERTRVQRKTGAPYFIDKMPNNFLHIGLIAAALPNAKIIDVRRHPLGCCFSVFKQHFARGQHFSYDLTEIGRYYRDYIALMEHFERVLPGRVHRVRYEALVENTEHEVRALLAYCGLPFEERCLRFYENERAVRTASSEQVRQPIFRGGLAQWRHYEAWLAPLKTALGPVLESETAVRA